ncbi:MAG: hypothetical protein L0099_01960 [Acidobacteria bacterium]|nr:hypothetical protein [Acidobacteriota bacterium]
MASQASGPATFSHDFFHARAKVFDITPKFFFYDLQGNKIGFLKQKLFKLKEDIRLYTDESMTQELLSVKARSILDFSTAYDVVDARDQSKVGTLKRKGLKSLVQDEWIIMDAADQDIGRIHEDSMGMALLRRFLTNLIPQSYVFEVGGQRVGTAKQHFNPVVLKMDVDLRQDSTRKLDRRLAAAAVVLLLAVEGRQE